MTATAVFDDMVELIARGFAAGVTLPLDVAWAADDATRRLRRCSWALLRQLWHRLRTLAEARAAGYQDPYIEAGRGTCGFDFPPEAQDLVDEIIFFLPWTCTRSLDLRHARIVEPAVQEALQRRQTYLCKLQEHADDDLRRAVATCMVWALPGSACAVATRMAPGLLECWWRLAWLSPCEYPLTVLTAHIIWPMVFLPAASLISVGSTISVVCAAALLRAVSLQAFLHRRSGQRTTKPRPRDDAKEVQ